MTKIKICGLRRECDVEFVNEAQPDFVGFIINVPNKVRSISPDNVKELTKNLDKRIKRVGVFVNYLPEKVAEMLNAGVIDIAQLHGTEDEEYIRTLRRLAPNKEIWKAVRVKSEEDVQRANHCAADMVLLDSGAGSGQRFDTALISPIRRSYILAGGLTPENIPEAVAALHPYAVDLSTGVETDGFKDRDKVLAAVRAVRGCVL